LNDPLPSLVARLNVGILEDRDENSFLIDYQPKKQSNSSIAISKARQIISVLYLFSKMKYILIRSFLGK
jgi:hypothetical protein